MANAAARAATYDVILCSPSLGTGVDITFRDNARLVDVVFGFCEPNAVGAFDAEAVFDTRDLQTFARFMLANKGPLENLLDHEVRSDVARKPTQQLGLILRKLGLGLFQAATVKIAGQTIRRYGLDATALSAMHEIASRRERTTRQRNASQRRDRQDRG